jgi:hypothetical protein
MVGLLPRPYVTARRQPAMPGQALSVQTHSTSEAWWARCECLCVFL